MTKKIKPGWDFTPFEIPDIGFQGLELFCDNFIKIYIYEQNILYTHNNFIEFLKDPGKKIRNFLIKKVLYKCSELKFFYEKSIN